MIFKHNFDISKVHRNKQNGHPSGVIWLYGLSGSGKSTLANKLEKRLFELGNKTYILDGDNTRYGLTKGLGFSREDRDENIRRVAETANLMADAGLIVICSFITPFEQQRELIRTILNNQNQISVFVDCDVEVCEKRDPKGLYKKARNGEISNFTGISSPFEAPKNPDIIVNTMLFGVDESALLIAEGMNKLWKK